MPKASWFSIRFNKAVTDQNLLPKLGAAALRLAWALSADSDNATGEPRKLESLKDAAKAAGVPYRTAILAMRELERHGLVVIKGKATDKKEHSFAGRGRGRGQRWRLVIPDEKCAETSTFSEAGKCAETSTFSGRKCAETSAKMCRNEHIKDPPLLINPTCATSHTLPEKGESQDAPNPAPAPEVDWFDKFWQAYPAGLRKTNRPKCIQLWQDRGLDAKGEMIVAAVQKLRDCPQWTKEGGRFVPHIVKFLEQEEWTAAEGLEETPRSDENAKWDDIKCSPAEVKQYLDEMYPEQRRNQSFQALWLKLWERKHGKRYIWSDRDSDGMGDLMPKLNYDIKRFEQMARRFLADDSKYTVGHPLATMCREPARWQVDAPEDEPDPNEGGPTREEILAMCDRLGI